ncbi:MAG: FtsX-like permease family protein, partial [Candidatus Polarisedimenticolia bacterium]
MVLGAAVCAALVTGPLVVGDSVKGSLAGLALDRIGLIEKAALSEGFIREEAASAPAVPAVLFSATVSEALSGARASGVSVAGIDARFDALYPEAPPVSRYLERKPGKAPPVVLNESLASRIAARAGDAVLIVLPRPGVAPADTPMGRRDLEHATETIRAEVATIVPDRGPGRFGLRFDQGTRPTAFLSLQVLQGAVQRSGKVNAILFPSGSGSRGIDPERALNELLDLQDRGLDLSAASTHVAIASTEFILRPAAAALLEAIAVEMGGTVQRVRTTVAPTLRRAGADSPGIPYSTITAIDPVAPVLPWLTLADGRPAAAPASGEILLNSWAARDLKARIGDPIEVETFTLDDAGSLHTRVDRFTLAGVTSFEGLGGDRTLTPTYPGLQDARQIVDWDPPFPVDLKRVRPADEAYWDEHGATPKAYVSESDGARLWSGRHGSLTALRIVPPQGRDAASFAAEMKEAIRARLPLELSGIRIRPVRQEALEASAGSTDFASLFAALSSFLIVSGALVAGMLFRLGVERRGREIGLLRALGYPRGRVSGRFLREGLVLAGAGLILGIPLAVVHASVLLGGLRGAWRGAVGTSMLSLHVRPASLAIGAAIALAAVLVAMWASLRRLGSVDPATLLAGGTGTQARGKAGWMSGVAAWAGLLSACGIALWQIRRGEAASPGPALAAGACLLVSAVAWFARWCHRAGRRGSLRGGPGILMRMAARNGAWNPGRSVLSVTLIACACFVLAAVAASGGHPAGTGRRSGTGGFSLVARSEIPLHADPGTREGREVLGLPEEAAARLESAQVISMRAVPGDDVSCLNLYRPQTPALLGVPDALIERGGFVFSSAADDAPNPWDLLLRPLPDGAIPAIGDQNSVQWILHKGLGDELTVRDELGREVRLRFVALLQGSIFQSEVLIPERDLLEHFPGRGGRSFFLIETGEADAAETAATLESALRREGFDAEPAASLLARFREVESTYLATFRLLGSLGLLLGTCGLGVVMARSLIERRAELAALRAIGFTRGALKRLVLAEAAVLVALGAAVGTAAALVALAPRVTSGASHPAWGGLAVTLALVVAIGVAASLA